MSLVSIHINLADSRATEALGRALALSLPRAAAVATVAGGVVTGGVVTGGVVVHLQGELGAGKTTCVRAMLRTLGVTGLVRSPTYTLVETYVVAGLTCIHVDLYRLQRLSEVDELGLRDWVGPGALLLVEWPEKAGAALPAADVGLTLRYAGEARQATLSAATALGRQWLEDLGHDTSLSFYVSNLT
jgi:tRNA threonylcarbamoyladenosine biosynthesis protein TsaE